MTSPPRPPNARELLEAHGLFAKKAWGQNFLTDQTILEDIAALATAGDVLPVVELGAGLGALTHYLAQRAPKVMAVERDRDLAPILRAAMGWAPAVEVREADAARLDYASLASELGGELRVAGNLPYQLSSRILVSLAEAGPSIRRAVLLVQREVAERLAADPGSRIYGLLSVLVQRTFHVDLCRAVAPGAFRPVPKVTSAVVRLEPHGRTWACQPEELTRVARAAFAQRRKTLRNTLSAGLLLSGEEVERVVRSCDLDPGARAETLSVEAFARLAVAFGGKLRDSGG